MGRLVDIDDVASTVKDAIKDLPSREVVVNDVIEIERVKSRQIRYPDIIVAKDFEIVEVDTKDGTREVFGLYYPADKQICVAGDVPLPQFLHVLFHELAHWIQDIADAPMDEDEAHNFADKLYQAIKWKLPDELKKEE